MNIMKVPLGFSLASINCGLRKAPRLDLGLIIADKPCLTAGFFTTNANPCYSVTFSKKNIDNPIKAVLVNSGNANCFSRKNGMKDTQEICAALARQAGVKIGNVLFASTGIIGVPIPKDKIIAGIAPLIAAAGMDIDGFAKAIITTDKFIKAAYRKVKFGNREINILGFTKGAGMICPTMATMLSFILIDAAISKSILWKLSRQAIENSFNSISVDGCMSTNDTALVMTSNKIAVNGVEEIKKIGQALNDLCLELAKMMVKDGEGATKVIQIDVTGAKTAEEARLAGLAIANSNLFKCAIYGGDNNWGRMIAAIGHAGIAVPENATIKATGLKEAYVHIMIDMKRGKAKKTFYTSDLTPEYIKINADYS